MQFRPVNLLLKQQWRISPSGKTGSACYALISVANLPSSKQMSPGQRVVQVP